MCLIIYILVTFHTEAIYPSRVDTGMHANFKIMCCFLDGVQQSAWLIDIVSAFNDSMIYQHYRPFDKFVSYIFRMVWLLCCLISHYFDIIKISSSNTRVCDKNE